MLYLRKSKVLTVLANLRALEDCLTIVARTTALPAGYVHISAGGRHGVACEWAAAAVEEALAGGTLHEWAAAQGARDLLPGRGVAYGVVFPAGSAGHSATPVVVRRNRHGGLLRGLTKEYFLAPTRAPRELAASTRLAAVDVPTPEIVAYAIYPVGGLLARSDVMTRRLPAGADFPAAWRNADASKREALLLAVASLLRALGRAGAWHPDLNLKNIYLAGEDSAMTAHVLDLDRVVFPGTADVTTRNLRRLAQSARKWRRKRGLDFGEDALTRLAALIKENR